MAATLGEVGTVAHYDETDESCVVYVNDNYWWYEVECLELVEKAEEDVLGEEQWASS